jgi:hypothetical protein
MASIIPTSFFHDVFTGSIDCDTDTFKRMLLTSSATPNKDTWAKRSDVTNEVANGNGYTTGGASATVTVSAVDTVNDRQEVVIGSSAWTTSTITARYSVTYKSRGGASSADELVFVNDFGADVSTTNGTLTCNADTIRIQN